MGLTLLWQQAATACSLPMQAGHKQQEQVGLHACRQPLIQPSLSTAWLFLTGTAEQEAGVSAIGLPHLRMLAREDQEQLGTPPPSCAAAADL